MFVALVKQDKYFGHCILEFIWNLVLENWNFKTIDFTGTFFNLPGQL